MHGLRAALFRSEWCPAVASAFGCVKALSQNLKHHYYCDCLENNSVDVLCVCRSITSCHVQGFFDIPANIPLVTSGL